MELAQADDGCHFVQAYIARDIVPQKLAQAPDVIWMKLALVNSRHIRRLVRGKLQEGDVPEHVDYEFEKWW
ncbi:hypothetical protein AXW83_15195 [Bosea sp. PAMC 26642]|nr:hypothetical protein AXW83_15195 [Bosea sp. PAMC 26642]